MSSWNFTDVAFDNMLEDPSWAFSHFPLNNSSEFILEAPKEGEEELEATPLDNMYDGDDEDSNEDDLDDLLLQLEQAEEQERLAHECYIRAKDSEQPNSQSNSSDYPQESSFNLQRPPPRINTSSNIRQTTFVIGNNYEFEQRENAPRISEVPRRKNRAQAPLLELDLPSPIDFGKVFSPKTSETMVNDFVPNMLEGFETMNLGELIQDYESGDILHPTKGQKFRCDIETPGIFSMEPHWFHDTKHTRCWCIHCIQYRKTQSTGEQMETHDFNYRCLCSSCAKLYHEALPKGQYCNCSNCTNVNEDEDLTDQNKALAELQKQIQRQSPERRIEDPEQLTDTSQKLLSDPLRKESTTVASESDGGPSELLGMIRENLWLDSDCDTACDSDEE
ncbi:hypothetical protein EAF00_008799 [Botryotinia globosa]|nr:hypothetical protein EAF00_008799 [Botryotinia globosa]